MKWILVYISVQGFQPFSAWYGTFDDMNECFIERETIMAEIGDPVGYQMVCVPKEVDFTL